MEAVLMNTTGDYNYKHRIGNLKRSFVTNRSLYSYRSDDLLLASFMAGSHFAGGSFLSMPPPAGSVLGAPPLLPLPISVPLNHHNMNMNTNIYRSNSNSKYNNNYQLSPPRINKNMKNRGRDHSLTPKKSKNQKKNLKKEEVDLIPQKEKPVTDQMNGPDPKDLPKDVIPRVFASSINKSDIVCVDVDKFSGSVVFTPSPPPSSLPLPTFSLRPKLSCKVEAKVRGSSTILGSGVDDGATDSLRRLLRL